MRAVVQRVSEARVEVEGRVVGEIGPGLLVLVGVAPSDGDAQARWLVDKIANLRVMADERGLMNRSLLDTGASALVVSQFTLYGDARRGRRPSFIHAAEGPEAKAVYDAVVTGLRALGLECGTGEFGTYMAVSLVNDGPVTILLDSDKLF